MQGARFEPQLGDASGLEPRPETTRPRVGVVLAAGLSSRMAVATGGGSKALLRVGGLSLVERAMRERGLSFKEAINYAIRAGLAPGSGEPRPYTTPRALGPAHLDLTKALALAAELEDQEIVRRLAEGR